MTPHTTNAFVLSTLKYGDNALICKCYTQKYGTKSFIVKGAYTGRNKKIAHFLPLSHIKIIYTENHKSNLQLVQKVELATFYQSNHSHLYKSSMLLFLAEILHQVLQEEEKNEALYTFLQKGFSFLDEKQDGFSDFHLWFLLELSRYLGFYPNYQNTDTMYFDLEEGVFTNSIQSVHFIKDNDLVLFKTLLNFNTENHPNNLFNQTERHAILSILMIYYKTHFHNFRNPKSLEVLKIIF